MVYLQNKSTHCAPPGFVASFELCFSLITLKIKANYFFLLFRLLLASGFKLWKWWKNKVWIMHPQFHDLYDLSLVFLHMPKQMHSPKIPTFCKKHSHKKIKIFFYSQTLSYKKNCKTLALRNEKVGKHFRTYLS